MTEDDNFTFVFEDDIYFYGVKFSNKNKYYYRGKKKAKRLLSLQRITSKDYHDAMTKPGIILISVAPEEQEKIKEVIEKTPDMMNIPIDETKVERKEALKPVEKVEEEKEDDEEEPEAQRSESWFSKSVL